jgi:hypothetical protein
MGANAQFEVSTCAQGNFDERRAKSEERGLMRKT